MSDARTMIEHEIGSRAAARVIEIAGGERLCVPLRFARATRLRERFGDELARLLVDRFADSRFYVPRAVDRTDRIDDAEVARLDAENKSAAEIARLLQCSDRTVHKSRARTRAARYVMGRRL